MRCEHLLHRGDRALTTATIWPRPERVLARCRPVEDGGVGRKIPDTKDDRVGFGSIYPLALPMNLDLTAGDDRNPGSGPRPVARGDIVLDAPVSVQF